MEFIRNDHKLYVGDLSALFSVAEETIRRDLARLERDGLLSRTYGGTVSIDQTKEDPSFSARGAMNLSEKQAIAAKAALLVHDNDTIMVDASTTALEVVYSLRDKNNLTIITTSIRLAADFTRSSFTLICTGGRLRSHSSSLVGPLALAAASNYHVDVAVVGCKSISREGGVMESNEAECEIKKRMIRQSAKTMLVADHSKFDKVSFVKLADFHEIDYLVTGQKPPEQWPDSLLKSGAALIY